MDGTNRINRTRMKSPPVRLAGIAVAVLALIMAQVSCGRNGGRRVVDPGKVVRADLDPELKVRLKGVLLSAHEDEAGRKILAGMMIERFVDIEDSAYDSIREMEKSLAEQRVPVK